MTPRRQRMISVVLVLAGVAIAVTLALRAFEENLLYFYTPTEVLEGKPPEGKRFRLGGLVREGSVTRQPGDIELRFDVIDAQDSLVPVSYSGVLPDLFRDGQGVIAHGTLEPSGLFRADELLAKHDENYMPPEVAKSLAEQGHPVKPAGTAAN